MDNKSNIYNAIQNLYNMDKTSWQEVLAMLYNLVADVEQKFEAFQGKFEIALGKEVTYYIQKMYEDGTLAELINDTLLKDVNDKVDEFKVEISEQLDNNTKYNNTINLGKLGIVSENVSYNQSTKTYNMTDISNVINNVINSDCDTLIFPSGNFLIENTITIDRALTLIGNGCNIYSSPSVKTKTIFKVTNSNVSISGFNFYSEQEYENNVAEASANSITSNITAISILGKDEYQKNVNVSNCYFDKFTQRLNILNSSLLFENCNITIKNSYETYCTLGFISGVDDFIFKNCDISFYLDRGLNIMNGDFRSVSLINCNINTTKNIICGQYDSNHINYSQTSSPVLKIYNTIIKNNNVDGMGASCFFMNIVKDDTTTPICELSNVTLYKCSGTSGGNNGKLFMPNTETQYIKNNVIDIQP